VRSFAEQKTAAAWATKIALLLTIAGKPTGATGAVPLDDFRHVRNELSPPPHVHVWVGAYGYVRRFPWQAAWYETWSGKLQTDRGELDGYSITFSIGHVAFHVLGCPGAEGLRTELNPDIRWAHLAVEPAEDVALAQEMFALLEPRPGRYLLPIWPSRARAVGWPPDILNQFGLAEVQNVYNWDHLRPRLAAGSVRPVLL
jgi:hypothetical protein